MRVGESVRGQAECKPGLGKTGRGKSGCGKAGRSQAGYGRQARGAMAGGAILLGCVAACVPALPAQDAGLTVVTAAAPGVDPNIVREIDDPATGDRWLLVRDSSHPGSPARMLLVAGPAHTQAAGSESDLHVAVPAPAALKPILHGGDPVVVEENTPLVEARLEGVALQPAVAGAEINVRLKISGTVVRAVVLAPGRVEMRRMEGGRP